MSSTIELPSVIYVWLVPSEQVLDQPGSWRIRKWDLEPFPEATHACSLRSAEGTRIGGLEEAAILHDEAAQRFQGGTEPNDGAMASYERAWAGTMRYAKGLPPRPSVAPITTERLPDNFGDSDRWQDPRDISGGETDSDLYAHREARQKAIRSSEPLGTGETPRTDAAAMWDHEQYMYENGGVASVKVVRADFARQLERELAAKQVELNDALRQRNDEQRLRQAAEQRQFVARSETASRDEIIEQCARVADQYPGVYGNSPTAKMIRALKNAPSRCVRPDCLDEGGTCNVECPGGEPQPRAVRTETRADIVADRSYVNGARFGWNCGVANDWKKFENAIGQYERDIKEATRG